MFRYQLRLQQGGERWAICSGNKQCSKAEVFRFVYLHDPDADDLFSLSKDTSVVKYSWRSNQQLLCEAANRQNGQIQAKCNLLNAR